MNLDRFQGDRQQRWLELEALVMKGGSRPEKLGVDAVRQMARLYRSVCADLAYARAHYPGTPIVERLEGLVAAGRFVVYDRPSHRDSIKHFFIRGYWQLLYERRALIWIATVGLVVPALFGFAYAFAEPEAALARMPAGFVWVTEAESTDQGMGSVELAAFSIQILTNNIWVTLLAFASGITLGFGTAYLLVNNGFILGALSGLAVDAGNSELLIAAVVGHGTLELSAIVIGAAAGLGLAKAVVQPGHLTRRESLAKEGRNAARIFTGTALVLVIAGFLEGFLSRTGIGWIPVLFVGVVLFVVFWAAVIVLGGPATSGRSSSLADRPSRIPSRTT